MTRRVDIGVPEIRVNETDCRVLRAVATRALAETGLRFSPVVASLAELAMSVGVAPSRTWRRAADSPSAGSWLSRSA